MSDDKKSDSLQPEENVLRDPLYQRSAGHELTERRHLLL
jgi:hypothetical protein